jgi:type IV secretory pathway VirJ component
MKREFFLVIFLSGQILNSLAQSPVLPLTIWPSQNSDNLIFYISGDGGMNKFSKSVCETLNNNGYPVYALDARSYFWEGKTPEQTASAISAYLSDQAKLHPFSHLIMIGYSFGANVLTFISTRLSPVIKSKLHDVLIISPSTSTDFEIHLLDIAGIHSRRSMNVAQEINKLHDFQVVTFFGSNEDDFPVQQLRLQSFHNEILPGGHHFDGKPEVLANALIKYIK